MEYLSINQVPSLYDTVSSSASGCRQMATESHAYEASLSTTRSRGSGMGASATTTKSLMTKTASHQRVDSSAPDYNEQIPQTKGNPLSSDDPFDDKHTVDLVNFLRSSAVVSEGVDEADVQVIQDTYIEQELRAICANEGDATTGKSADKAAMEGTVKMAKNSNKFKRAMKKTRRWFHRNNNLN